MTNKRKETSTFNYMLIPILFTIAFIPLIVHEKTINSNLSQFIWYTKTDEVIDIFLYWKAFFFVALSCIMVAFITHRIIVDRKRIKFTKLFIPIILYLVFTIISAILSTYPYFTRRGINEQFESIWVLIGYVVVLYYSFLVINSVRDIKTVIRFFVYSISIECAIGLSQLIKRDFFKSNIGSKLISGKHLNFTFEAGRVYGSLFNPNYVGLYAALTVPIILMLVLFTKERRRRIDYGIIGITLIACVFGAQAKNGMVAIIISLLLMLFLLRKFFIKYWKCSLAGVAAILILFVATNTFMHNAILNNIKSAIGSTEKPEPLLTGIATTDNGVSFVYNGQEIRIQMTLTPEGDCNFIALDQAGNSLSSQVTEDGKYIQITDSRFTNFYLYPMYYDNVLIFSVKIDEQEWYFTNQIDGTYYYCNIFGKFLKLDQVSTYNKSWSFASGRGYIWDKTVPIIKNHLLFGTGPDTFAIHFPNTDYLDAYNAGFAAQTITKPHNMYMQIAAQTGILSLLAFIIFYILYFVSSLRIYIRNSFATFESQIGAGILVGTFGYMISGLVNDATVAVTPVYWALIGIGIAINRMIKKNA